MLFVVLTTGLLTLVLQACSGGVDEPIAGPAASGDSASVSTAAPTTPSSGDVATSPTFGAAVASTTSAVPFWERTPALPAEPFSYHTDLPGHFRNPGPNGVSVVDFDSTPADNPVTDAGAALGRVLFYDVNLSRTRMISCASCHVQQHAFTDPVMPSLGVAGVTRRNSMSLSNVTFNGSGRVLWDEEAATVEEQVLLPFEDPIEMGLTKPEVAKRVGEIDYYEPLLIDAFGSPEASIDRVADALAQFVRSMVSVDAPYDRARAGVDSPVEPFPEFTDSENLGKRLFFSDVASGGGNCSACHVSEAQITSPGGLKNNGIDATSTSDLGGFEISGDRADLGAFRVPSLRNIEVSGPYMHDGRFFSLEEVVEHYSSNVQPHSNLSGELRTSDGQPARPDFTPEEKAALVDFLETLTDESFLTDDRFRSPFK